MDKLRKLYQETVLDHYRCPRNYGELRDADHHSHGHNPLCGDRVTVYVTLREETVTNVSFLGSGCAVSKASASLMTDAVKGKTTSEIRRLHDQVVSLLNKTAPAEDTLPEDLTVLKGVLDYPSRVRCATLPWHTLRAALDTRAAQ